MIKEKLMDALKDAVESYNGGLGASESVAKAAEAADFNEKQAERLAEMFNTTAALRQQQDKSDPTASCELASKDAVSSILMGGCGRKQVEKSASDYSFYGSEPERTSPSIEARAACVSGIEKYAFASDKTPDEFDLSQDSLFRVISGKIDFLKSAGEAAGDVAGELRREIESGAVKIAEAIDMDQDRADMFMASCSFKEALKAVSGFSEKLAHSDGGVFSRAEVFDPSPIEGLLKDAEALERNIAMLSEYESKRDLYISKSAEALCSMEKAVGLSRPVEGSSLADFFDPRAVAKCASARGDEDPGGLREESGGPGVYQKIAELIMESGIHPDDVERMASDLDKEAASVGITPVISVPSGEIVNTLSSGRSIPEERQIILNVRRAILLSDLMANDPIIRDADPNAVVEAYKTMVMTAPRVSLDKAQVRSVLRAASNSVAISPSDVKVLSDVDKGTALSNVGRMTALDSSIKDSNIA